MENIRFLIEKYFDGALSAEEERNLVARLRSEELSEELQADKELILAMCTPMPTDKECDAVYERVEAMIDALAEQEKVLMVEPEKRKMPPRKHFAMPRIVWSLVALFAIVAGALFVYDYEKQTTDDVSNIVAAVGDNGNVANEHKNNIAVATVAENDTNIAVADEHANMYSNRIAMAGGVKKSDNTIPPCDNAIVDRPQEKVEPEHRVNDENIVSFSLGEEPEIYSKYNVDTFDNSHDAEVYLSELLSDISSSINENRETINRTTNSIRTALDENLNSIL